MTDGLHDKSFLMQVGKKIKMFREEKNYTQEELANLCGLKLKEVIDMENGDEDPWMETLVCISDFLNVPVEKFFKN